MGQEKVRVIVMEKVRVIVMVKVKGEGSSEHPFNGSRAGR
jgi:hypothetical protein